ncbi:MAG TPA: GNAT family N-acetyltransferase [Anaerolineales bacterium]|nr:GNAT family N-acetyltransferase [Anaerolineales bacterium]
MREKANLDPSLNLRPATWSDLNAVAELTHDVAEMDGDASFVLTAEELANEWKNDDFNVERDVFIVETQDGRVVGSEEFYNESGHFKLKADGCVHPDFRGLGIGTSLLEKVTERSKAEMELAELGVRVFIQTAFNNKNETGHTLLKDNDYSPIRYFWRMETKLQQAPPTVIFPDSIEVRPFIKDEHAVAVWRADNEAFRDHWGSHYQTYEEWSHRKFSNPNFDPSLWMVAWDKEQIAGFSQNRYRKGIGWIGTIGVRRPWRKKGLGLALLQHSFVEFYRRGMMTIGLGVDASNLTGATRLYQKAGMKIASEYVIYEKELRPGREPEE